MQVLIIDDDVVSRMVLMHLIDGADSGGGLEVLEAEDGEEGWTLLDGGLRPAMVFCDLRMPRLSGMELLARLRADARFATLPFVLASAANDAATMEQALGLGADGYVVKPFDQDKVAPHLARLAASLSLDPDADESAEQATARLGIDSARLLLYLGGLQRQLDAAAPAIARLLADGQFEAARAQLERLREGCATLGLHGAAAGFAALPITRDAAPDTAPDSTRLRRAIDGAGAAVQRQVASARGQGT